jgi:hypothetical protein
VGAIALELGFKHVSLSSETMPMVRIVPRGYTGTETDQNGDVVVVDVVGVGVGAVVVVVVVVVVVLLLFLKKD